MDKMLFLAFCLMFSIQSTAQVSSADSLLRVLSAKRDSLRFRLNTGKVPEEERPKVVEEWKQARERAKVAEYAVYLERPQQHLMRQSKFWIEDGTRRQDSLVDRLIYLVSEDSMADYREKDGAIRLLAKARNKKAHTFLLDNLWRLSTTDDYNNTDYWYVKQNTDNNWVLFPQIIHVLSTQKLEYESFDTIALLLDNLEQDTPLLASLLNLYVQKYQNEIFTDNVQNIIRFLEGH
ncbi:MAG: hypothetical protein ACKVU0_17890 [Saprospiraceae bacterium]